ncbi:MAG: CIA30 family protein [Pseudomonadota bacterium]
MNGSTRELTLFDAATMAASQWVATDDPVMGGESFSAMRPAPGGTARFAGTVSLANNGGFASVHRALEPGVLSGYHAVALRICGDGRRYSLRLRQADSFDGVSYRYDFDTTEGRWVTMVLPLAGFRAVFRGRQLTTADPLVPARVNRVSLLIARQPGPFNLQLRWLRACREEPTTEYTNET